MVEAGNHCAYTWLSAKPAKWRLSSSRPLISDFLTDLSNGKGTLGRRKEDSFYRCPLLFIQLVDDRIRGASQQIDVSRVIPNHIQPRLRSEPYHPGTFLILGII